MMIADTFLGSLASFQEMSQEAQISFLARCIRDGQPGGAGELAAEAGLPVEVLSAALELAAQT